MSDLAKENERLRRENECLQALLEGSLEGLRASADYWRSQYMMVVGGIMNIGKDHR